MKIFTLVISTCLPISILLGGQLRADSTQGMFSCLDRIELAERFKEHMNVLYETGNFKITVNGKEMDGAKVEDILSKDGFFNASGSIAQEKLEKSKGHLAYALAFEKASRARSEANYKLEQQVYTLDNRATGDLILTTDARSDDPERQKYASPVGPDALVVKRGDKIYALTEGFMTRMKVPTDTDNLYFIKVGSTNNYADPVGIQATDDKLGYIQRSKIPKADEFVFGNELATKLGKKPIDLNLGRNTENDTVQVLSGEMGKIVNRIQDTFKAQMEQVAGLNDSQKDQMKQAFGAEPPAFANSLLGHYESALKVCAQSDNKAVKDSANATLESVKATFKQYFPNFIAKAVDDEKKDGKPAEAVK